ncbi:MAG: hypothetical protein M3P06_19050 [Acidobacteriota bacterium]|nr:hypothetical protein [Acidobacteriota bacterium]
MVAAALALEMSGQQQFPTLEKGFQPEKLYQFGGVDSVNVFNGTLMINLPIGPTYALDGGVSYGLRLSYNSKPWDLVKEGEYVHAWPSRRSAAGMGWILGMGRFIGSEDPFNTSFTDLYEAPDGGDHRFDGVSPDTTCASLCPSYTSDGSNLRLRRPSSTIREVDFPDGITKKFIKNAAGDWELREIRNARSSDTVTITPVLGSTALCASGTDSYWTITDSGSRTHTVCFTNLPVNSVDRPMVNRVVFATPGTPAIYQFTYVAAELLKPNEDTDGTEFWRQTHDVQLLDTLTLPDGSTYRFALGTDVLGSMTLPTLGKIEYQYEGWRVPSTQFCNDTYGLGYGFAGYTHGVKQRTFTPAVPAGQTPVSPPGNTHAN